MIGEKFQVSKQRVHQILGSDGGKRIVFEIKCGICRKIIRTSAPGKLKYGTKCKICVEGVCGCGRPKYFASNKCKICHYKSLTNPLDPVICSLYKEGYAMADIANAGLGITYPSSVLLVLRRNNIKTRDIDAGRIASKIAKTHRPIADAIIEYTE